MLSWIRRAFTPKPVAPQRHPMAGLVFKSNEAFFEMQCRFGDNEPRERHICYGIVEGGFTDAGGLGPTPSNSFERVIAVRLATHDGGRITFAPHHVRFGLVFPGDLVAWMPLYQHPAIGWQGILIAKCEPAFTETGVKIAEWFMDDGPEDMRPD